VPIENRIPKIAAKNLEGVGFQVETAGRISDADRDNEGKQIDGFISSRSIPNSPRR